MASRGVNRLRHARRRAIAVTVIGRTKIRPPFHHFPRDRHVIMRTNTHFAQAAARIARTAAIVADPRMLLIPITGPFPAIADHVEETVTVRRIGGDLSCAGVSARRQVLVRKFAMPGIGHRPAGRRQLVTPGVFRTVKSAAGRKFPFRLGRQELSGPCCVSFRIFEGNMHDGMIFQSADRALRTTRMAPIGARSVDPPIIDIARINPPLWSLEHDRSGDQQFRNGTGIVFGAGCPLGKRNVVRSGDEMNKFGIGYRVTVDSEAVYDDAMSRRFFWIVLIGAHHVTTARNPFHA